MTLALTGYPTEHLILCMFLSHERYVKMVDLPLVWYVGNTLGVVVCGLEVSYTTSCQQFLEVYFTSFVLRPRPPFHHLQYQERIRTGD